MRTLIKNGLVITAADEMAADVLIEGEKIMIVASRGGDDTHPAWFLNLRDEPKVEVALVGEGKRDYVAHVADATERARLWPLITAAHDNYAGYQKKTDREIPVVVLEPAG